MQANQKLITACLSALALTLSPGSAPASTITNADTSATLNLPGAWVGGVVPASANVAVWDSTVQANLSRTLGASASWAGIQELNPGGPVVIGADGSTLTLGASGIDLSLATYGLTLGNPVVLGANQYWNVAGGIQLLASGAVSGSGNLTKTGSGTLVLSVANTYSGGTTNTAGILQINTATSLGTGPITLNGGTLVLPSPGVTVANTIVNNAGTTSTIVVTNTSANPILSGTWNGAGTIIVTNSYNPFTVNGVMDAFSGTILIPGNVTFRFNSGGGNTSFGSLNATFNLGSGTATLQARNAATINLGALTGGPGTSLTGQGSGSGTLVWSIGNNGASTTFNGTIKNNTANEVSALTKTGSGTLTLTGTNTFTGAVTVSRGVLQIGDGGADGVLGGGAIINNASLVFDRSDSFTTLANAISGSGSLFFEGGGTNTFNGVDTSSGPTIIANADLVLGASGSIAGPISVAAGSTFDVSQNPSYTLTQTLSGSGTVTGLVSAASSATIFPGGAGASGTLTFLNGLTESGNVNNQFFLSAPGSTNDLINIVGNLTLANNNYIVLSSFNGGAIPVGTYPLFAYTGSLNGGTNNFIVSASGVTASLVTLATTPPEIAVVISPTVRGATNLFWKGDGGANNWDLTTSNWFNGATSFNFQTGDRVSFNDSAAPNTTVNLALSVLPGSVVVSNTQPYTLTGAGSINGPGGLTKTNSGLLTIDTLNGYTGPTVVGGGTLQALNVANGGSLSAIGAAASNPTNLVFYSSTFAYSGTSAATDRGATLNGTGATFDVIGGSDLTLNGTLNGPGALTLVDTGTLTLEAANGYTGGTVVSNGVLAAGGQTANVSGFGPATSPIVLTGGTLTLYNSTYDDGSTVFSFSNPLVVPAGQTGTLNVFRRGDESGTLTGGGTLNISASGARGAFAGNWSAFTGTLNITGDFRIENTYGYSNAVINVTSGADLSGGTSGGVYSSNPTFSIGELDGAGTLNNNSKVTPYPIWQVGWLNSTSVFGGTIQNPNPGAASINKVGTGIWYLAGQNTYSGNTTISEGVLALTNNVSTGADGSIADSTNIFINTGAALDLSGTLNDSDTFFLGASQVLSGYGTLRGLLDTTSGGTVTGGGGLAGGVGVLTVTNSINLGGVAWLKLNRASSPNSDRLVSSTAGLINYGGTLLLTNVGPRLQVGDTFTLFSAPTITGSFGSVVLPNYYTFNTSQLAVNGRVSVTGVSPAPAITSVDYSQLANGTLTLNSTGGVAGGAVTVLATTNLALPLASWTTAATGNFDASGNLSQPVTVDPALPQQYFLLQSY